MEKYGNLTQVAIISYTIIGYLIIWYTNEDSRGHPEGSVKSFHFMSFVDQKKTYLWKDIYLVITDKNQLYLKVVQDSEWDGVFCEVDKIADNIERAVLMDNKDPLNNIVFLQEGKAFRYKNRRVHEILSDVREIVRIHKKVAMITKNGNLFLYTIHGDIKNIGSNVINVAGNDEYLMYLCK